MMQSSTFAVSIAIAMLIDFCEDFLLKSCLNALLWFEVYRSRAGSSYCGLRCTEVGVVPLIVV